MGADTPPTEEERRLRAEWFDKEWGKFRKEAEEKGIPHFERASKEIQKELEEWVEEQKTKQPFIITMKSFFSAVARGIPLLVREAMKIGYPLARQHFINQPVVIKAGLTLYYADGREKDIQIDLEKLYGEKSWMRVPLDEVILRASPDGSFLTFETLDTLTLFKLKDDTVLPIAQLSGESPLGWSLSGKFMFVSKSSKRDKYAIIHMDSLKEIAHFELSSCLGSLKGPRRVLTSLSISEELFIVGGWDFLCVYNFSTGAIKQLDIKTLRSIGAIYGLVFSEDGRSLYIASSRGFFIMDPYNFSVLYEYINHPMETGFDFQKLLGVSPDGRYAAVMHGRERHYGWATLVIWDIYNRKVVQRIGDKEGRMLQSISSGFRFIYPPAILTKDWRFLLTLRQDGVLELYQSARLF